MGQETSLKIDIEGVVGTTTFELPTLKVIVLVMGATALIDNVIFSYEYIWVTLDLIAKMEIPDYLSVFFKNYMNK